MARCLRHLQDTQCAGFGSRLRSTVDTKLAVDISRVCLRCAWGDTESPGDLVVREAISDELQYLALALAE